jgi:hypothetical protein
LGWNLIGGLIEGVHFPKGKYVEKAFIDLTDCKGIIVVTSEYFLENKPFIEAWALKAEKSLKEL